MSNMSYSVPAAAIGARKQMRRNFLVKGISLAVTSGICYGMYTTFIMVGQSNGSWVDWYGGNAAGLSTFAILYLLGMLGGGINDSCAGIWAMLMAAAKGKGADVLRCIKSRPTLIIVLSALIGGTGATSLYVIALQLAGSMIIPITTTYPALGAVMARIFLKQKLTPVMGLGVVLCLSASLLIGSTSVGGDALPGMLQGCIIAFIAAVFWATEGVVLGYATTFVDYEIMIAIRQCASGIMNLAILLPLFCLMEGTSYGLIFSGAVFEWSSMKFFVISGFFSVFAFSLWYKGNNMCGAALGMAANSAYCFWGPLFCWIIVGLIFGQPGWELPAVVWIGAVIMFAGILLIALNPSFKKGGNENAAS